jgi:hypothetical protein
VGAGFVTLHVNPGSLIALWANQHHVGNIDWTFELNPARIDRTALGLHLLLVLGANIDTLHDNTLVFGKHVDNLTALALILEATTNDFYRIAFTNFDFHNFAPTLA